MHRDTLFDNLVAPARIAAGLLLCAAVLSQGCQQPSQLERVQRSGELTIITRNGATAYYTGADGEPTGFEYDLAAQFAAFLGVDITVKAAERFPDLFPMLENGAGDLIAANISRTAERRRFLRFGPHYETVTAEVVYRRGEPRPVRTEDLVGNRIRVIAGSSYESLLQAAKLEYPDLQWQTISDGSIEDLLEAIDNGEIDYTLVDSTVLRISQRYFPGIRRGFSVGQPQALAWVFPSGDDDSLLQKAREFFALVSQDGRLAALKSAYFDSSDEYDHAGMFTFMQQVQNRLLDLRPLFEQTAAAHRMDWRLLAAVGYQESHWDPLATSPTGVRGLMMLTLRTAEQLGVSDRLDPEQSIDGGTRYLKDLIDNRIPKRIQQPDRLWLALAAYNIGFGHLEDARVLTERRGGNPDRWEDVSQGLLLLSKENWYTQTRYGYARGYEAVRYVNNIQSYYDTLVWMDTHSHPLLAGHRITEAPTPALNP